MLNIIERFTEQHYQIISLCKELKIRSTVDNLKVDAAPAYELQKDLHETLGAHLRLEDQSLYPMLIEHHDPTVRDVASRFQKELAECPRAHNAYQEKYPTQKSIEENIHTYAEDTYDLAKQILERIQKEETELYSLLR